MLATPSASEACGLQQVVDSAIASYAEALRAANSLLVLDETVWAECEQQAREILADCVRAIHGPCDELPAQLDAEFLSLELGARRALQHIPAMESLRAAQILTGVVLDALPALMADLPHDVLLVRMQRAVKTLHQSIGSRVRAALIGYDAFQPCGVDPISSAERARLARELHDRIGGSLALAMRSLELHELEAGSSRPGLARVEEVKAALQDTFGFVRELVNGLRAPRSRTNFHTRLLDYIELSRPAGTTVDIQVEGSTAQLTPLHHDEIFLVIRECLRNAYRHSAATDIRVEASFGTDVLRVRVTDNGKGVDVSTAQFRHGNGMISMRERITAMGGILSVTNLGGKGTLIRFFIPVPDANNSGTE
ncbi:sensor histidine kinase [Kitasatospora sp. NPDC057015]|uniref:sensor histidine kinase n=1 Tax=Kitasatospora sp. NPDC057015 TaxID=3346001 RepID=UPI00363CA636